MKDRQSKKNGTGTNNSTLSLNRNLKPYVTSKRLRNCLKYLVLVTQPLRGGKAMKSRLKPSTWRRRVAEIVEWAIAFDRRDDKC